jgi:hypothetical protein
MRHDETTKDNRDPAPSTKTGQTNPHPAPLPHPLAPGSAERIREWVEAIRRPTSG